MSEAPNDLIGELALAVGNALGTDALSVNAAYGEVTAVVQRERIVDVVTRLRDAPDLGFVNIVDICGVDYPERADRFDVVYHLLSPTRNARLRLKVTTDEVIEQEEYGIPIMSR